MKKTIFNRFLSLSLRTHLLLLALLLALPALALIIHSGSVQRKDSIHKGFRETRRLVHGIANEQYNQTGNAEQLLMVLAHIPDIEGRNAAAANALLSSILKKNPQYGNIVVTDRSGNVWASALPFSKSFSLENSHTFRNTVATRRFSSGEYIVGRISAKPSLGFGYPIINAKGEIDGIIAVNFNFDHLHSVPTQSELPAGSSFSIIDRNGVIVYRNPDPESSSGTKLREDAFLRMKNGPDRAAFIDTELSGDKRIVSYRKLRLPGEQTPYMYIRASIPEQGVLEKARRAQLHNIAVLSLFLLTALLLAIPIGNYCFVNRIKKLQEASHRLAEGDQQVRISELVEGGELGELAHSFDEMARQLTARELALRKSQEELTRRVEEETERRLKHERLLARHARLAAIGEMIGAIAHQWRQPLATLGATIQSIRMAWEEKCLDNDFLENAEADAQMQLYYMSDTIEDFRNFFSPEKVIESFDVREKINEVVLLVAPQFANSGVSLRVVDDTPGSRPEIRGYQNEFKQSVLNLVSNSFDSIRERDLPGNHFEGGHGQDGLVTISVAVNGDIVAVEVQDNGCGIPGEYADKVFEPYFTSKSTENGTGIGLYMSRLIIEESMGGRLSFASGPDGTVFRIEVPRDVPPDGDAND